MDLMELLSDSHKEEVSRAAADKLKQAIDTLDVAELRKEIQDTMVEDIKVSLQANYISDEIPWSEIGGKLGDIFIQVIDKNLRHITQD